LAASAAIVRDLTCPMAGLMPNAFAAIVDPRSRTDVDPAMEGAKLEEDVDGLIDF
jgi:hypothetical protein